jgi:hypothetical protein
LRHPAANQSTIPLHSFPNPFFSPNARLVLRRGKSPLGFGWRFTEFSLLFASSVWIPLVRTGTWHLSYRLSRASLRFLSYGPAHGSCHIGSPVRHCLNGLQGPVRSTFPRVARRLSGVNRRTQFAPSVSVRSAHRLGAAIAA